MSADPEYDHNSDVHKKLLDLAPGVFLASAAYSNQGDFPSQLYPKIYASRLVNVKTPAIFNDTKVHVALVGEWDDKFKVTTKAGAAVEAVNGDVIPASRPGPKAKSRTPKADVNLVFSFRGTEPWNACNWLADFDYEWRDIDWWQPGSQPKAHSGFLQSLESVTEYSTFDSSGKGVSKFKRDMPETLEGRTLDWAAKDVLQQYNDNMAESDKLAFSDLARVVVVGHSLGAAIATLASVWLLRRMPKYIKELENKQITCITTGSPRVGDTTFADEYFKLMKSTDANFDCYRVVHNCDVVPSVPLQNWGFRHVGKPIWLRKTHNNWSYVYLTMMQAVDTGTSNNDEVTARPLGYSGWVLDHFEWNYSTAMAQALATTISPSMPAFLKKENTGMRVVRELLHGPFFTMLSLLLWIPAKVVVMIGKLALANVQDSQASMVAALYRFAVNMLFAFFTVPMYILTHLTYYM